MKIAILVLTIFFVSTHQESGYCWREYVGTIPADALRGGRNNDGTYSYVAQGYFRNNGLIPTTITPGVQEIFVNYDSTVRPSKYNKILCGHQRSFEWQKVDGNKLQVQISGKDVVIGGHDDSHNARLSIGRIFIGGKYIIGKIVSYQVGKAYLLYIENGTEKQASSFDILIYINNASLQSGEKSSEEKTSGEKSSEEKSSGEKSSEEKTSGEKKPKENKSKENKSGEKNK